MENGDNSINSHPLDTYPIYLDFRKMLLFSLNVPIAIQSWMTIEALTQHK